MSKPRDVIVTGIPRSGTTLTAALIDRLPNTVCLNEPGWQVARAAHDGPGFARFIRDDFVTLRARLLKGDPVPDRRSPEGTAVTNYYATGTNGKMQEKFQIVPFTRAGLTSDFTLAIKHNGPYLAVLDELVKLADFRILAVVRHPVEVIYSWRSLDIPISRGELPNAVPFWKELADIVKAPMDLLEKQVRIYDLMWQRIHSYRDKVQILPYASIVQNPAIVADSLGFEAVGSDLIGKPSREVPPVEREKILVALQAYGQHLTEYM